MSRYAGIFFSIDQLVTILNFKEVVHYFYEFLSQWEKKLYSMRFTFPSDPFHSGHRPVERRITSVTRSV